jgi:hypothetical protein
VRKINGAEASEATAARSALSVLQDRIETIIRDLHWKDFEILVDLIFRQAGWQRTGILGETLKILDLDLVSPITRERYGVQIKSRAKRNDFEDYQAHLGDMKGYTRFFFVVHTPSDDLVKTSGTDEFQILLPKDITYLSVKYGLTDWILERVG